MDRRRGIPRTEEERKTRHEELFPGTSLPERGSRFSSQYGAGRRRVYWEREGGFLPLEGISRRGINRTSQEEAVREPIPMGMAILGLTVITAVALGIIAKKA